MANVDRRLAKVLKKREGAHENYVSAFGKSEHLRVRGPAIIDGAHLRREHRK